MSAVSGLSRLSVNDADVLASFRRRTVHDDLDLIVCKKLLHRTFQLILGECVVLFVVRMPDEHRGRVGFARLGRDTLARPVEQP